MTLFNGDPSRSEKSVLATANSWQAPLLLGVGAVTILFGLITGFTEIPPCGSAFIPRDPALDLFGDCPAAVGAVRVEAVIYFLVAAAAIVGGLLLRRRRRGNRPLPARPAAATSIASQIMELSRLHKAGVLDDSEFAAAKRKLLGGD